MITESRPFITFNHFTRPTHAQPHRAQVHPRLPLLNKSVSSRRAALPPHAGQPSSPAPQQVRVIPKGRTPGAPPAFGGVSGPRDLWLLLASPANEFTQPAPGFGAGSLNASAPHSHNLKLGQAALIPGTAITDNCELRTMNWPIPPTGRSTLHSRSPTRACHPEGPHAWGPARFWRGKRTEGSVVAPRPPCQSRPLNRPQVLGLAHPMRQRAFAQPQAPASARLAIPCGKLCGKSPVK